MSKKQIKKHKPKYYQRENGLEYPIFVYGRDGILLHVLEKHEDITHKAFVSRVTCATSLREREFRWNMYFSYQPYFDFVTK